MRTFGHLAKLRSRRGAFGGLTVGCAMLAALAAGHGQPSFFGKFLPNGVFFPNPNGASQTYSSNGGIDLRGPFFQSLGSNGRTCASCHTVADAMGLSAATAEQVFRATRGMDPLFRPVDGSNCDHDIDVSTLEGREAAYSLLRTRGLFRIAIAVPPNANYRVMSVSNPYGCNDSENLSMYRRPLPATNLRFLSAVMSDGRESSPLTGTQKITYGYDAPALLSDLEHQALDATLGHAQANEPGPTAAQLLAIAQFELGLTSAQSFDRGAGLLWADGAKGGPAALVAQPFFISINSSVNPLFPLLEQPGGLTTPGDGQFTPAIFHAFDAWANLPPRDSRAAIARGEAIFNSKTFAITGVAGLNDAAAQGGLAPGGIASIQGTCGTCHDTPNVGDHSFATPLDIGTGDPDPGDASVNLGGLDIGYLPRITVCKLDPNTGQPTSDCKTTSDPGQALIDGNFDHVGKIKGPILRGLAARAPYFHNGSAKTLLDVVRFYEKRFGLVLTPQEESDLVAFLRSL